MSENNLYIKIKNMTHPDKNIYELLIGDISLTLNSNKVYSLIGPSGCGKTTFLRIIAGLEHNFNGKININNEEIKKPTKNIQIVFQDYRIIPWLTVKTNLLFTFNNKCNSVEKVDEWLKKIELFDKKNNWPKDLSGGEIARIAFARAFVNSPQILLLDEPFRSLDLITKNIIQEHLISFINQNHNIITILVSHSIDDAIYLSDEIFILSNKPMKIIKKYVNIYKFKRKPYAKIKALSVEIAEELLEN